MPNAAKAALAWLVVTAAIEGLTAWAGQRVAIWGAITMATLLLLAYGLLQRDFTFLQPWLWHTVGVLMGVVMIVGVVAAFV
ncbi:hypothetical protein [Cryptosporangium sp. NPDC048952]|uniref:hypothetical protein n=1 Tax=Cryptosporangium sp. NPDC048952 TaxID=3363961 RepID=UPI0037220BAC